MGRGLRHNVGTKTNNKYRATEAMRDGIRFDSTKEARYYDNLKWRRQAGEIAMFLRQVPFHLPGNVKYVVDFMEFHADGSVHFVDVKGMETAQFKTKKKLVEALYPVEIELIKNPANW